MEVHNPKSADQAITPADVPPEALDGARMLYVGGTMFLGETGWQTALGLMEAARARRIPVAFDPNVRPSRTPQPARVRARLDAVLPLVDVLQASRPAWADLWGDRTPDAMLQAGLGLLVQTDGAAGALLRTPRHAIEVPAAPAEAVDPTGAGDAFLAALLARLTALPPGRSVAGVPAEDLVEWGHVAAAWAARVVRHLGAVTAYRQAG
jgi:fructokinase